MGNAKKAKQAHGKKTASKKPGPAKKKPVAKAAAKAKPAKKAPKPKAANAKAASAPKRSEGSSPSALTLTELQARWPALAEKDVEAFETLISDAQAATLGQRTKSEDVLREATRWAVIIDEALRSYGDGALKSYTSRRFAYYLQACQTLAVTIEHARSKRGSSDVTRTSAEDARKSAVDARAATIERLATYAGMRAAERKALEDAMLTDTHSSLDLLVRSLRKLAFLEVDWVERLDPTSRILAESAGLSHEDAETLRGYADSLGAKHVAVAFAVKSTDRDTAAINRVEGRVLFEMKEARRVFASAHERNPVIPQLIPGSTVKHVFAHKPIAAPPPPVADEPDHETNGAAAHPEATATAAGAPAAG